MGSEMCIRDSRHASRSPDATRPSHPRTPVLPPRAVRFVRPRRPRHREPSPGTQLAKTPDALGAVARADLLHPRQRRSGVPRVRRPTTPRAASSDETNMAALPKGVGAEALAAQSCAELGACSRCASAGRRDAIFLALTPPTPRPPRAFEESRAQTKKHHHDARVRLFVIRVGEN